MSTGAKELNPDLIEIAKANVREAMRKEIEINQQQISSRVVYRNTSRFNKIEVFTSMARNNALRHFLNLDESQQLPHGLKSFIPMSEEYKNLMYKTGATTYAPKVKKNAENQLYLDYTHTDYKRKRHFLDEKLPEQPKSSKFWEKSWEIVGNVIVVCFRYWWVSLIAFFIFAYWINPSSTPSSISSTSHHTGRSTFGSGGVSGGNAEPKSVSDKPQVKDHSQQTGFGNGGKSGHDSPSSVGSNNQKAAPLEKPYDLTAEFSLIDDYDEGPYKLHNGESASLIAGQSIEMHFELPVVSGAVYKLNGKEIKGRSSASKVKNTWFEFIAIDGENVVTVEYRDSNYHYKFNGYSSECFRNQCVI